MICLCCGKPLKTETGTQWHKACIKRFFGTTDIPYIELGRKSLEEITEKCANKGITIPGVQKKLCLYLKCDDGTPRLTSVKCPTEFILKPQVENINCAPEIEQLVMCMADAAGISTVPHALIRSGKHIAYISKRIDRLQNKSGLSMLAMEDFCQLDSKPASDKYNGSCERCAEIIKTYSSQIGLDISELFMRLVFSFIVGNSDMHLKNFSLLESSVCSGNYYLSPAYDLVSVSLMLPDEDEEFALPINGKKKDIKKDDFLAFAKKCNISEKSADKMIFKLLSMKKTYIDMCNDSLLPENMKKCFIKLIESRCNKLSC